MTLELLLDFVRLHRFAVQSSVSPSGTPQAALVGFAITNDFEIVFDTLESTRKVANLRLNSHIALVIGGWESGDERTVQCEGEADEPSGVELERLKTIYFAVFPDGPSRASWPGLTYVRVRPTWIRYSDFNFDPPRIVEFAARELLR
jgi:general stress protein 26